MSVTDQQMLGEIQDSLVEPNDSGATWPSGMWTAAEMLNYLNNRQNQFLKDTGLLLTRVALPTTPNVNRQPLPIATLFVQDLSWENSDLEFVEVPRADTWEADYGLNSWQYQMAPVPQLYSDGESPSLSIQIMPAPSDAGVLWCIYVAMGTVMTGAGVAFTVPDECASGIKWGAVADALSKIGRALDRPRAQWAEARYQESVEAVKMILLGWEAGG